MEAGATRHMRLTGLKGAEDLLLEREDGASGGVALVSERPGGPPEQKNVRCHAERSDGVPYVARELPKGVRVPSGVSHGGGFGAFVSGMPE